MVNISDIQTSVILDGRNDTEKKLFSILGKKGIAFELVDNDVVESMDECEEIDKVLGAEIRKSIFLCNKKKTSFFLIVLPAAKALDSNLLSQKIGVSNLSFASPEYMEEHLRVKPGSLSVAGLVNDEDDYVQVFIDKQVTEDEWFCCNTGVNTSHLKIKTTDLLQKYLPAVRHKAKIIEL
mgnify:CR=1 FL=1